MSIVSTLKTYGQIGVDVLRNAVSSHDATGKTRASIRFEADEKGLRFFAREFFELLEKGRRPTTKGPSPDMIEFLTEYAKARGMSKPESAAWAMAVEMNKKGDLTHRRGGRIVYSDVMTKFTQELGKELMTDYGKEINLQLKGYFK